MSPPVERLAGRAFAAALLLLTGYHVTLLGQGALAWGDEGLYPKYSVGAATALLDGSWGAAAAALAGWGSRPGEYLLRLPAAMLQLLVQERTGLPVLNPDSLRIATAQNVLVSLGLGLAFWRVSRLLLPARWMADVASIAFVLLTQNQIWVRHLLPYDAAMLVHFVALHVCLRGCLMQGSGTFQWKRSALTGSILGLLLLAYPFIFFRYRSLGLPLASLLFAACCAFIVGLRRDWRGEGRLILMGGLASGIALSIYPAYYAFTVACGLLLFVAGKSDRVIAVTRESIRMSLLFGAAVLSVMLGFEMLARVGGVSYLGGARLLAGTINQGSFDEGFVFLATYLLAVDGPGGLAIIALAAVGLWALIPGRSVVDPRASRVILVFSCLYLAYAFQSVVLQKMVFTGRYARMYIPALIWLAAIGLWSLRGQVRHVVALGWVTAGVAGFAIFASEYRLVGYPIDVLYRLGIGYEDLVPENVRVEFLPLRAYNLPVKAVTAGAQYITHPNDRRFVIVNFALPSDVGPGLDTNPTGSNYSLVHDSLHFISARSFGWEGATAGLRERLYRPGFHLEVFRASTPSANNLCPGQAQTGQLLRCQG